MDCFATQTSRETVFKEKGRGGEILHLLKVWLERSSPTAIIDSQDLKYLVEWISISWDNFFPSSSFSSFSLCFVYTSIPVCAASSLLLLLSRWPYQNDVSSCNLCLIINSLLWICSSVNGHWSSNAHFLSDTFPSECYFFSFSMYSN